MDLIYIIKIVYGGIILTIGATIIYQYTHCHRIICNLKFIHISKTGGSSIENSAKKQNINWGRFHYNSKMVSLANTSFEFCPRWHIPPRYFSSNPFQNYTTFTVVRNPYTRCLSEFNCQHTGYFEKDASPTILNEWIHDQLRNKQFNGHFIPCSEYVFNDDGSRFVDHVLKFENLNHDFSHLMKQYNLPIKLKHTNVGRKNNLTINDFHSTTIQMINNYFHDDFVNFNYSKL